VTGVILADHIEGFVMLFVTSYRSHVFCFMSSSFQVYFPGSIALL